MENLNIDLGGLFGEDQELLSLLSNQEAAAAPATNAAPIAATGVFDLDAFFQGGSKSQPGAPQTQPAAHNQEDITQSTNLSSTDDLFAGLDSLLGSAESTTTSQPPAGQPNLDLAFDLDSLLAGLDGQPEQVLAEEQPEAQPEPQPAEKTKKKKEKAKSKPAKEQEPEQTGPVRKSPVKRMMATVFNLVFWVVCITIIGASALFAFSNDPQKSYFGYRFYNVLTNSMKPQADGSSPPGGFVKGDIILVKMVPPEEIKELDIITFQPGREERAFLTHRVVQVREDEGNMQGISFVTRGDANDTDDPPIYGSMLIGRVEFAIPKLGAILKFVRNNFILAVILIGSTFGFILVLKYYFKGGKQKPATAPLKPAKVI